MNNKELRRRINDYVDSLPGRMIVNKVYVKTVGYKYVTVIIIYDKCLEVKYDLAEFYNVYQPYISKHMSCK